MERNFKLIFEGLLSLFISINILILTILIIDYSFNLKPTFLSIVKFDLFVSFLIIIDTVFRLDKETNKCQYLTRHWIDILAIIPWK